MKCEGCPLWVDEVDLPAYKATVGGCAHFHRDPCHLTPDHKRIIKAMIRGVFDCGHCKWLGTCDFKPTDPEEFCAAWQERKEGEDGH